MNLLDQLIGLGVEIEKRLKEAYDEGYSEAFDALESEIATVIGDEASDVDLTVVQHVKRIRAQRDRLLADEVRMDWLQENPWFRSYERKAIDEAMALEENT